MVTIIWVVMVVVVTGGAGVGDVGLLREGVDVGVGVGGRDREREMERLDQNEGER